MSKTDTLEIIIIKEGHGMKDVSCRHGSRWIWLDENRRVREINRWTQVVLAPGCDCEDPPSPHFQPCSESQTMETKVIKS